MAEPEETANCGRPDQLMEVTTQEVTDVTMHQMEKAGGDASTVTFGLDLEENAAAERGNSEALEEADAALGSGNSEGGVPDVSSKKEGDVSEGAPQWDLSGQAGEVALDKESPVGVAQKDCRMDTADSGARWPPQRDANTQGHSRVQETNGSDVRASGLDGVEAASGEVEQEMDVVTEPVHGAREEEQSPSSSSPSSLPSVTVPSAEACLPERPPAADEETGTAPSLEGAPSDRGSVRVDTWTCSRTSDGVGTLNGTGSKAVEPQSLPLKIKDEPMDEEYDRALAPNHLPGGIKVEPEVSEDSSQQQGSSEELRISAVFSVSTNANSAGLTSEPQPARMVAAPSKTLMVTMNPPALAPPQTPTAQAPTGGAVRVSCSGCRKVLMKGQTAYQRKGSTQLFCSTICLTGYNVPVVQAVLKKTCHSCQKEIGNPKDVIMAPVDTSGTMRDFCSQTCLTDFDVLRKAAATTASGEGVTIKCGVCQKTAVIRHEVNYQGVVHKLCSDTCFSRFRSTNRLTMNCCENCGGYCYSGSGQCHMLQIEGATKKFCSPACITAFKQKSSKVTPCTMCFTLRSSAEMVESVGAEGRTELFCSSGCVTAHKVQSVRSSSSAVQCNQCRVTAIPQYHLAMSDSSMRNFCSYNCVVNFQTVFNKAATQAQLSVVPPASATPAAAPQPAMPPADAAVPAPTAQAPPPATMQPAVGPPQPNPTARGLVKLTCKHCFRLFASKPEAIEFKGEMALFCGKTCSEEFKKINFVMARCEYCKIEKVVKEVRRINHQDCSFCSEGCKLLYKHDIAKRWGKHCKSCTYCTSTSQRVVQNHFGGKLEEFCGDVCMSQYTVLFYQMSKCDACRRQGKLIESLQWLGEMKHFCNLQCLLQFCSHKCPSEPPASPAGSVPQPAPAAPVGPAPPATTAASAVQNLSPLPPAEATPVIANVVSLASAPTGQPSVYANTALQGAVPTTQAKVTGHASTQTDAVKLPSAPASRTLKNKALLCKPMSQNKGTICKPHTQSAHSQTDPDVPKVVVLPVPVPVFLPVPLNLYSKYTPFPVGLPLPVPVPMFLPTALDSAERIGETIQEIREKIPSDPYEADIILIADRIAQEKEENEEKPAVKGVKLEGNTERHSAHSRSSPVSAPHSLEVKAAPSPHRPVKPAVEEGPDAKAVGSRSLAVLDLEADYPNESFDPLLVKGRTSMPTRHRGRRRPRDGFPPRKRGRKRASAVVAADLCRETLSPVGGSKLQYVYGVNAWKNWIQTRNPQQDVGKSKLITRPVLPKEDLLQCGTAELSYGLCQFVSEVRRPGGEPYSPDTIFYLCLGIQQYLFENGRMENIFTDTFYSKFIQELGNILKGWKPTILASGYLHSRIEEELLWECKQLGAYSPMVLLNTLLFLITKLFHLKSPAQHGRLSFAEMMRCSRTLKNGSKTNFLRVYPLVDKKDGGSTDKLLVPVKRRREGEEEEEVMEMQENTENPLRCPIRLYEFYLSKCPDTVKQRSDLFYLQPERCCVPSSPLWFSCQPLEGSTMEAMLARILTVREVHLHREETEAHTTPCDDASE